VRIRHFPLDNFAPESTWAAEASECAAEQNLFWPYHDILFQKSGTGAGVFARDRLKAYARDVPGLDTAQFDGCVDSGKYVARVQEDRDEGRRLGVNATPSVYVDNEALPPGIPTREALFGKIQERLR